MTAKTSEQIAEYKALAQVVQNAMGCERRAYYGNVEQPYCGRHGGPGWPCANAQQVTAAVAGYTAAREAQAAPEFAPEGEEDKHRDLWDENMPRVSGCMYFSIPGEQPIHVDDELARHILATLSEQERGIRA